MIEAELPDGTVLEFPDGTSPDVMKRAVLKMSQPERGWGDIAKQSAKDIGGGLVRGAGSIGATLLYPWDKAQDLYHGDGLSRNEERRQAMDSALANQDLPVLGGADPNSFLYKAGKLGGEIAGTAGAGGVVANGLRALPAAAKVSPGFIEALRTGGMSAGGSGALTRAAGGAASGAASAGLVDPNDALAGAVIGGVAPSVIKAAGVAGDALGNAANKQLAERLKEFNRAAPRNETLKAGIEAGYVVPPNLASPSFGRQVLESISGKQATQQIASNRNEKVTGDLVRKSLGIAEDAPLTAGALEDLRRTAGKAYADVSGLSPQAAADLEALKVARNDAQGWFKAYNRSARPDDLAKAKEARALSESLEDALEKHAADAGKSNLIPALRDARKQIAKTYTVGRALNDASGEVDARVLGRMHEKGLPLSDGLDVAGRFASAFPSVMKSNQQIGSPAAHNLKSFGSLATGAGGAALLGPYGAAAAAIPFVAPPAARALMFRKGAQEGLIPEAPDAARNLLIANLLRDPRGQELLIRSAPVVGASQ